ncbi:hypothetical protein [Fortiea contorta]|uniref:hypothetical protein n=1 Tax=Fortiea contorta TaxID=1892405 RepID=UPI000349247C|nr:hypothetical protein [Fortiea contorta]
MRRHRLIIYILLVISSISIAGAGWAWKRSPRVSCHPFGFIASSTGEKHYISPEKIVVKPWRGRHHVYGVFMVPKGYENDRLLTIKISENKTYCGLITETEYASYEDIDAKPGYHLIKGYLNTRLVVFLMAQGKIEQLKQPSNWKLGYVNKK